MSVSVPSCKSPCYTSPSVTFEKLLSLMLVALDIADEADDFSAARRIMVLSQTFYANVPEGFVPSSTAEMPPAPEDPDYFQKKLRYHRVWDNMRFWESAVYESIGSEMSKFQDTNEAELQSHESDVGNLP